jgi:acyl-CoA-binding protein
LETQEKEKRKAWQKHVDDDLTPEDAEKKYIDLVNEFKTKYGERAPTEEEAAEIAKAKAT